MRKNTWEMLGEFLREAAVLVLVFALLEPFALGRPLRWVQAMWVAVFTVGGLVGGIAVERRRKLEVRQPKSEEA